LSQKHVRSEICNSLHHDTQKLLFLLDYRLQAHKLLLVALIFDRKTDEHDSRVHDAARHALESKVLGEDDARHVGRVPWLAAGNPF